MAYGLPHSQFLGIDLSEVQIAQGRRKKEELNLSNLHLEQMDIMDFPKDLGLFDYIIAHGVFSWVPPQVREKILAIYRAHLAPHGIGFISYNTLPGWHMINIARDIMLFETRTITDPTERVDQAREALRFYAKAIPGNDSGYFDFLKSYSNLIDGTRAGLKPKDNSALYHDELSEINQPFYFMQFIEMAEQHGLSYLADLCQLSGGVLPKEVMEALRKKSGNLIELEQAEDFLNNRTFRQTLLCLQEAPITRKLTPAIVNNLYITSQAQPVSEKPDLYLQSMEQFRGTDGALLTIDHPCSKAALACLAEVWPCALVFPELLSRARARLEQNGSRLSAESLDAQVLGANLLRAFSYSINLVDLHSYAPALVYPGGDYPVASRVARNQAVEDYTVTNLYHERVNLDDLEQYLLPRLDGTQNLQSLLQDLVKGLLSNEGISVEKDGQLVNLVDQPDLIVSDLKNRLDRLAKLGLFIDPSRLAC